MFSLCSSWRFCGIVVMTLSVLAGCEVKPAAEKSPAGSGALPAGPQKAPASAAEATPTIDSPAFESPQEAVAQWVKAYQQDGEQGHRRITFDQNGVADETWQKTLEAYDAAAKEEDVEVLEVIQRDELAAVIVRLGERVNRICLYQDAKGWHLCRTLNNWDAVKMPKEYRGLMKTAFNLGGDAGVSEIQWRKKLSLEDYANESPR